jgi:hypothetical protein
MDTRGVVEKQRELRQSNRLLVIERARRMTLTQELRRRQHRPRGRGREPAQIDFLSRPARPHCRRRSHDARIRIGSAGGVGVPTLHAARVEQKIVEIPEHEAVVALGRPQAAVGGRIDVEKDLAVHQQGNKLDPEKTVLPTELSDLLRRRQQGDGGRNLRIADPEQGAGARRFEDHFVAASPQIREPRQDEDVVLAELRHARPIVGNLRLDDDLVRAGARAAEAILQ